MARPKNKNQNKTVVKTKQIVNIINNSRPKRRGRLVPSNGSIIRNIYHAMPTFQPIYNQPQPVGTRPDLENEIKALAEVIIPLQRAVLNIQSRDALFNPLETPKKSNFPFGLMRSGGS